MCVLTYTGRVKTMDDGDKDKLLERVITGWVICSAICIMVLLYIIFIR